jgi:CMP-N-acetylneuraminic acid synthetase
MGELRAIDYAALSKKLQRRAEECRALAQIMTSADAAAYLRLAKTYDAMAERADQLAAIRPTSKKR